MCTRAGNPHIGWYNADQQVSDHDTAPRPLPTDLHPVVLRPNPVFQPALPVIRITMSTTTTSRQLSPQSNAFEPYRLYNANPTTADRAAPRSHEQSSAQGNPHGRSLLASAPRPPTSALPWQTAPIADHDPTVLDAIRALNEHYAQKAFPPDEIDPIVERYNEHLALIQAALDLRDGWSKPQVDAGFLPLPKADEGDPSNTTVFIGGLSSPIPTDLLRVFFIPFGDIDYVSA